MTIRLSRLRWWILALVVWLVFWGGSGEFRSGMDSMTYGALAKHVLSTGDWKTLHYAHQAYSNFYQHPPLVIWMAAIVFKAFGASDLTSKIVPDLLAVGTIAGVALWGRRLRSSWHGFVAAFVLLLSTRFIKYSFGLMLDPALACFLVWGAFAFWRAALSGESLSPASFRAWSMGAGACFAAAALSKGVPAIALPVTAIGFGLGSRRGRPALAWGALGAALPLGAWLGLGDGVHYAREYWIQSVSARLGESGWRGHLAPALDLLRVYWPWLPFYAWGIRQALKERPVLDSTEAFPAAMSLMMLAGFTVSGHFLEQYLVPFYPFAALVVASVIAGPIARFEKPIVLGSAALALGYGIVLASFPVHVHGTEYRNPIRELLKRSSTECRASEIDRVRVTTSVADVWWGLAVGLWYTPWDARVDAPSDWVGGSPRELVLHPRDGRGLPLGWERTDLAQGDLAIFDRVGSHLCP